MSGKRFRKPEDKKYIIYLEELKFTLVDSTIFSRKISEVWLEYAGRGRTVQVILGKDKDEAFILKNLDHPGFEHFDQSPLLST